VIDITDAVKSLRPNTDWAMIDNDIENIIWHTEGVEPLTTAEVQAEVARLERAAVDAEVERVAALESASAKLAALGLDEVEVAAVMGVGR